MSAPPTSNKRSREDEDDLENANLIRRGSRGINLTGSYYNEKHDHIPDDKEETENVDLKATVAFHQRRIKALEDMLTQIRFDQLLHVRHLNNSMLMQVPETTVGDARFGHEDENPRNHQRFQADEPQRGLMFGPLPPPTNAQSLDEIFRHLETTTANEEISGPEDDDDIAIRILVHGWPAVARMYRLDTIWKFMQSFDKMILTPMGDFARLASLRAVRAVIVRKARPYNQSLRPIPAFFQPTLLQQTREHPSQLDYFPWPNVRDFLLTNDHDLRSIPHVAHTNFAENIWFHWRYKLEDTYKTDTSTGRFSFTQDFLKSYHDLRNWCTAVHDDKRLIPAHLQADPSALAHQGDLRPIYEREDFQHGAIVAQNFADPEYPPLVRVTTVDSSHDGHSNEASPHVDISPPEAYNSSAYQSTNLDFLDMDALGGSGVTAPSNDDWKWAFDDTRPEYGSMQSLFDMAIPL